MYIPEHFAERDRDRLFDLMRRNSFAMLVSVRDGVPIVSHLPLVVEPNDGGGGCLYGHFARANPHWQALAGGQHALVVFQGPHSYVSPSWYEDTSNVPTWNYAVVHAEGPVELLRDPAEVLDIVSRLTDIHEGDRDEPWRIESAAPHLDKMLSAIVGFRLRIESLQGKFKLSQNRAGADRRGVLEALSRSGDDGDAGVARLMRDR